MKAAMKAGEKDRLGVIRLMMAAIKQREIDERVELGEAEVVAVLDRMIKQRRESIAQFEAAARDDLASIERAEIEFIKPYLPAPLAESEVSRMIEEAIAEVGVPGIRCNRSGDGAAEASNAGTHRPL
jgi:uncharacterized protein YqeY